MLYTVIVSNIVVVQATSEEEATLVVERELRKNPPDLLVDEVKPFSGFEFGWEPDMVCYGSKGVTIQSCIDAGEAPEYLLQREKAAKAAAALAKYLGQEP